MALNLTVGVFVISRLTKNYNLIGTIYGLFFLWVVVPMTLNFNIYLTGIILPAIIGSFVCLAVAFAIDIKFPFTKLTFWLHGLLFPLVILLSGILFSVFANWLYYFISYDCQYQQSMCSGFSELVDDYFIRPFLALIVYGSPYLAVVAVSYYLVSWFYIRKSV